MSTAQEIYEKTRALPESAQREVLRFVDELARTGTDEPAGEGSHLTLQERAELRARLSAWEEDWNAPGMEAYDRP